MSSSNMISTYEKMFMISGGRPEASKSNLNFQSATWDSSIGPGGSRMVSPPVHFPKLILRPPLFMNTPYGDLQNANICIYC
jgi:hypothetical protein